MDYLHGLNNEQKEAVLTPNKYVRVIAGAGSGKTRVLTTRIAYLIEEQKYSPYRICAITFTNKAAHEMKERLVQISDKAQKVHVSTIHALCVRILREDYEHVGLTKNFTILDTSDQSALLKDVYKDMGLSSKEISFKQAISFISNNKSKLIMPKESAKYVSDSPIGRNFVEVYKRYQQKIILMNAVDFDDLLVLVHKLLKENEIIRNKWQSRFDVVFVDEFQDIDAVQYHIINDLVGKENGLYVVGDPDQTIYTWRGANVSFMVDFEVYYPMAHTVILNQNYRSTSQILNSANALIAYNKQREAKDLIANKDSTEPVRYNQLDDGQYEADYIGRKISSMKEEGISYNDIAVLYRSNYLSRALEKVLMNLQIPYLVYGGLRFYDHAEVKDFLSYLRMITHNDDLALRRSIQMPRKGIGAKTIDNYYQKGLNLNQTIYQTMLDEVKEGKANSKITNYVNMIEDFKTYRLTHSLEELMTYVLHKSGLLAHFEDLKEEHRVENLKELIADAVFYEANNVDNTLEDYVQMISLYSDRNEVVEGDYVRLMTVHAAKGLEFEHVFIMGVGEGVFPNKNSIMEGSAGIEEERRLMYVAMTRAKETLTITNHSGYNFVTGLYAQPSRFIDELDEGDLLYEHKPSPKDKIDINSNLGKEKIKYQSGEVVYHEMFGEGIVINCDDEFVKVAFNYPHGTKKLSRKLQQEVLRKGGK